MIDKRETEELIGLASDVGESLKGLADTFRELLPLMDDEHAAIKVANLGRLEAITKEKESLGLLIETKSEAIFKSSERIRLIYESMVEIGEEKTTSARDVNEWLKAICSHLDGKDLAGQVLKRVTESVARGFDELRELKDKSRMKIEMNSYLTKRLLEYHRENIRLWQEVISECEATYSPKGESRAPQAKSVLQVKA